MYLGAKAYSAVWPHSWCCKVRMRCVFMRLQICANFSDANLQSASVQDYCRMNFADADLQIAADRSPRASACTLCSLQKLRMQNPHINIPHVRKVLSLFQKNAISPIWFHSIATFCKILRMPQ